jgi:hypothetical protein
VKSLMELVIVIGTIVWIGALLWTGFMVVGNDVNGGRPLMDYMASSRNSLIVFGVAVVAVIAATMVKRRLTTDD